MSKLKNIAKIAALLGLTVVASCRPTLVYQGQTSQGYTIFKLMENFIENEDRTIEISKGNTVLTMYDYGSLGLDYHKSFVRVQSPEGTKIYSTGRKYLGNNYKKIDGYKGIEDILKIMLIRENRDIIQEKFIPMYRKAIFEAEDSLQARMLR